MSAFINYEDLLHDEISLEGRSGITLEQLWKRIEDRVDCFPPLALRYKLWAMIKNLKHVNFFSKNSRLDCGGENATASELQLQKSLFENLKDMPLEEYLENYESHMFLVASEIARWKALAPNSIISQKERFTAAQYNLLENIGKTRNVGLASFDPHSEIKDDECKASKAAFYLRKILLTLGLIWQEHTVANGKSVIRFRLGRFRKNMLRLNQEDENRINVMENVLKQYDNYAPFIEMKNALRISDNQLKILLKSKFPFCEMFKIVTMNFKSRSRIFVIRRPTEAEQSENPCNDYNWEDSFVAASHKAESEIETGNNSYDVEDDDDGPWTRDVVINRRLKLPLLRQAYVAFAAFGPEGATMLEISKSLGYGWRLAHCALKLLQKAGVIKKYMVDYGKLRYARYFVDNLQQSSKSNAEFIKQYERLAKNLLNFESGPNDWPDTPTKLNITLDNLQITVSPVMRHSPDKELSYAINHVKTLNHDKMPSLCSLRYITRTNIILEVFCKNRIIPEYNTLKKLLCDYQVKIKDTTSIIESIDRKILQKLIEQMYSVKLLKIFKAEISIKTRTRTRIMMCMPQVKLTEQMIIKLLDADLRKMSLLEREVNNQLAGVHPFEYRVPKMERVRIVHEFMFQLTWKSDSTENASEIVPMECCPDNMTSAGKARKEVKLGDHDISFNETQFLPLSDNNMAPPAGWPQGWVEINKATKLIPRKIFLQLSTLNSTSQVNGSIFNAICFMSNMGLVNFDKSGQHIYINRYATLIEKTDHLKREHKFHFSSPKAVKIYWDFMRAMCLKHKDIVDRDQNKDEKRGKTKKRTSTIQLINSGIEPEEAPALDRGLLPGNGCGFAGFDSSVSVTKKASWHRHIATANVKVAPKRKRPCLPRDCAAVVPRKKRKRQVAKNRGFQLRVVPTDNGVKSRKDLSLPRRKLVWKPEELHVIFLARIAGALLLHGKVVSVRMSCHMRSIMIDVCEMIFKTARINSIVRPFIYRRLKLLSVNRQIQRVLDVKLTEAKDIVAFREYIGLYHKMRSSAKKMVEVRPQLQVVILELILGLHHAQVIKNTSSMKVFKDIDSLYRVFKVTAHDKKFELFEKPKCVEDIEHITIQNGAVAVLGSADEGNWTPLLSKIRDDKLRLAVKALQVRGVVALRNKFYRLSQNYVSTVAALNMVTIELQADLEDIASGRTKVVECGPENLPFVESTHRNGPTPKVKPMLNPDLSNFENLMTLLKNTIANSKDMGCSGEDIKLLLHQNDKRLLSCNFPRHSQTCIECLNNIEMCLHRLTSDKEIHKVGYDCVRWVSKDYIAFWTIGGVCPEPWTKADGSTAETAFFRWMGTVLWCILDQPGVSCADLAGKLHLLRPTQITTIVRKLEEIGSVQMETIDTDDFGLMSPDDYDLNLRPSLNVDSLDCILITATADAVSFYEKYKKTIPHLDQFDSKIEIASGSTK